MKTILPDSNSYRKVNQDIPATCAICQDAPPSSEFGLEGLPVCDDCAPSRSWIITEVSTTLVEKSKSKSGRTAYGGSSKGGHVKLGYGFWACINFDMRVIVYHDSNQELFMPVGDLEDILMVWRLELGCRHYIEQFVITIGLGTETKREDIAF